MILLAWYEQRRKRVSAPVYDPKNLWWSNTINVPWVLFSFWHLLRSHSSWFSRTSTRIKRILLSLDICEPFHMTTKKSTYLEDEYWKNDSHLYRTMGRKLRSFFNYYFKLWISVQICTFSPSFYTPGSHKTPNQRYSKNNRLVKVFHWQLKASLLAPNVSRWTYALLIVLPGIRNIMTADIGYTVFQLIHGTTLWLPGEPVEPSSSTMNFVLNSQYETTHRRNAPSQTCCYQTTLSL